VKYLLWLFVIACVATYGAYGAHLLNIFSVPYLSDIIPPNFLPKNTAELGVSFGLLSSFLAPLTLVLALVGLITQSKQQAASNSIGALSVRQQFLLFECERLESSIKELKEGTAYKPQLFNNMVAKQKSYRDEATILDEKIKSLLTKL